MRLLRAFGIAADQLFIALRQSTAVDVCKTELAHIRNIETSALFKDVADRVGADVAEVCGIGQRADTGAVKHDQNCSFFHVDTSITYFI